jgi:hypothetical protein
MTALLLSQSAVSGMATGIGVFPSRHGDRPLPQLVMPRMNEA